MFRLDNHMLDGSCTLSGLWSPHEGHICQNCHIPPGQTASNHLALPVYLGLHLSILPSLNMKQV